MSPERLLCSAVYVDDGKPHAATFTYPKTGLLFCGRRHIDCFQLLYEWRDRLSEEEKAALDERSPGHLRGRESGFLTSTGRYVDRVEGWDIAKAASQILPREGQTAGYLYSEDIY